jgi:predicted adenine nucleotide alpha hydrolase (AANH) superfamily ATPase
MTDAQWKVMSTQISDNVQYELRRFRKKCITQGIVKIVRDHSFYEMTYRGRFVCYLYGNTYGDNVDKSKLRSAWSVIRIAEETIEKIEGVKHEGK